MPLPDVGLIHAWLDGQLPPEDAERVERLVATDPAWAAAAAEARGLIAASSRILSALDDAPSGVLPAGSTTFRSTRRLPWWTKAAAAIVLVVGGSTLVLQRASAPVIDAVSPTPVPVASKPVPNPVSAPVMPPVPVERRDVAKAAPKAAPKSVVPVPAKAALAEQPKAQALTSAPLKAAALAQVLVPPSQEARAVGGVLPSIGGGVPAQRVLDQRVESQRAAVQRTAEQQAGAQRDAAAAPVMARMESPLMANKAANALAGVVVTGVSAAPTAAVGACYAMQDSKTTAATGIVMRGDQQVADTLFLAPLHPSSPMRGWVMLRNGVLRGVITTEAEGRGMMLVTAAPVSCTAPTP
jgi:hypothetical protein